MVRSMEKAQIRPADIDHVSVSANYAKELERMEFGQVERCLQCSEKDMWVSPIKYLIGDFGAAGTTRAAAVLLSLYHQVSLPSISVSTFMKKTGKPLEWAFSQNRKIDMALMTSTTFGGGPPASFFQDEPVFPLWNCLLLGLP